MKKGPSHGKGERPLRHGYTTGTCAAAAAGAAAKALQSTTGSQHAGVRKEEGNEVMVEVELPKGERVLLNARIKEAGKDYAIASVIKDAGDDPDVTNGAEIIARVRLIKSKAGCDKPEGSSKEREIIAIKGGRGVGRVTKPGLQIPVGEPAINPVPRMMIREAVREVLGETAVEVTIEIPAGEELAKKTFNPRLGIVGGISVIGSTGIVEPKSLEALKATVKCEIDVAWEEIKSGNQSGVGSQESKLSLAPGKIGEDALKRIFGDVRVVQTSNFIGDALGYAKKKGFERVLIGGHPGKLAKVLMGYYDTHSRNSPQATEFVAEYVGLKNRFNTVEEIIQAVRRVPEYGEARKRFSLLAADIAKKIAVDYQFRHVEVYLFDIKKSLTGEGRWDG